MKGSITNKVYFVAGFAVFLGVLVMVWRFFAISMGEYRGGKDSENWPFVEGEVVKSELVEKRDMSMSPHAGGRSPEKFIPLVEYTYFVNGSEYRSNRVAFTVKEKFNVETASKVIEKLPVGKKVKVYYDPKSPASSVLQRGSLSGINYMYVTLFIAIIFVFSFMAYLFITEEKKRKTQREDINRGS